MKKNVIFAPTFALKSNMCHIPSQLSYMKNSILPLFSNVVSVFILPHCFTNYILYYIYKGANLASAPMCTCTACFIALKSRGLEASSHRMLGPGTNFLIIVQLLQKYNFIDQNKYVFSLKQVLNSWPRSLKGSKSRSLEASKSQSLEPSKFHCALPVFSPDWRS